MYTTQRADGGRDVARRRSDGIGDAEILTSGAPDVVTVAVGPTGDWIVYSARGREDRLDIFGLNTADGGAPMVLVDNERVVGLVQGPGSLAAYPMGKGSGSVTTFSQADGFVTIGRHEEIVEAGATVVGFSRFEVGEGIEKKSVNFAEEVAAQAAAQGN